MNASAGGGEGVGEKRWRDPQDNVVQIKAVKHINDVSMEFSIIMDHSIGIGS